MRDVESQYIREFSGRVLKTREDWLLLDRTAFYPEGGGQPSDRGALRWEGGEARVTHVSKRGAVKHRVEGALPAEGAQVAGEIFWDLRHRHMRMHTSQHVVSGVAFELFGVQTLGAQIGSETTRVDLGAALGDGDVQRMLERANDVFARGFPITVYEEDRDALLARLADKSRLAMVPSSVRRLRVVEVAGVDLCPCAGTHVRSTSEIGQLRIVRREPLGTGAERLYYDLDAPLV